MKKWLLSLGILLFSVYAFASPPPIPLWDDSYQTTYKATYDAGFVDPDELEDVQCPIPMENRVLNYTGIQCVYSSIEALGRWAEESKLTNPPLTSRADCKSFANPGNVSWRLNYLKVRYEQSYLRKNESRTTAKNRGLAMIRKAMKEHRGAAFGVPGHMMTMVHFDETANVVKWFDNSDKSLKIQTMTIQRFMQIWDLWVIVIYADKDVIQNKMGKANTFPILDRNKPQGAYKEDYIPMPR